MSEIRFGYVATAFGQLHYAESGDPDGKPLLCLHQTPRSWDEFRELLPLLGAERRAIAMDTLGMGQSAPPSGLASIEAYAAGAVALLDGMGIERASLLGHHTGGVIAIELAASAPDRIDRMVLTSTAWVDAASRERRKHRPPIDEVEQQPDGTHLAELWQRRQPIYPPDRPDVLERFVHDALAARDPEEGHLAVGAYRMEERIGLVQGPVLVVGASNDPYAFGEMEPLAARLANASTAVIDGGTVGLLEDKATEVAALTLDFLR
jgi:pimeloyl-ACP methyl ester carboxylesterase